MIQYASPKDKILNLESTDLGISKMFPTPPFRNL